jgi:hypothetical protein
MHPPHRLPSASTKPVVGCEGAEGSIEGKHDCGIGVDVSWQTDCSSKEVTFTLRAPVDGWVGLGLLDAGPFSSPTTAPSNFMKDADMFLVSADGSATLDGVGQDFSAPTAKASKVSTLKSATVKDGLATVVFSRKFTASTGVQIKEENGLRMICAYHTTAKDLTKMHERRAISNRVVSLFERKTATTTRPRLKLKVAFKVEGVTFAKLEADTSLLQRFKDALKAVILEVAGAGITADMVTITLSAGSVQGEAAIEPPSENFQAAKYRL